MRFSDLQKWLYANGWRLEAVRGSHHNFRHTETRRHITVAVHGREIEPNLLARVQRDLERKGA